MEEPRKGEEWAEVGLLLIVTGLFVGVLVASLLVVWAEESKILTSLQYGVVAAAAVGSLAVVVLVLLRKMMRFVDLL